MIRRRIGSLVVRAYPRQTRRARGVEMVDTLLDASEHSSRTFIRGCASLLHAGLNERGRHGARLGLGGLALVLCGAGTAVVLTVGGASPPANQMTGRVPAAWLGTEQRAVVQVSDHESACRPLAGPTSGTGQLLQGAPPSRLSSLLAVLRQPAPATARVSAARVRQLHVDAQGVYIRYARQGIEDGITYYMIPAANVGAAAPMPKRCYAERLATFEEQAERLPAAQRPQAIAWERELIKRGQGPRPGIAMVTVGGGTDGTQYVTADQLRNYPWRGGGDGSDNITKTALVLPDAAASVTARYAAQSRPGRVPRPVTITHQVSDNLVVFVFRGAWDPPSLTYRSATGTVLWTTATG